MSNFSLRPVSPSPSPTASTTSPDEHHTSFKSPSASRPSPPAANGAARQRRPFSPSFLRDVDLTQSTDPQQRKYPAPPTGHDLMAMFPPPPPDNFPELRSGPTSGYFQRQERAFFAQAGKEIVRVRVEIDLPHHSVDSDAAKSVASRPNNSSPRQWPPAPTLGSPPSNGPPGAVSQSPSFSSTSMPVSYPHPASRAPPRGSIPVNPASAPLFPLSTNHPLPHSHPAPPPNLHATGPLPQNGSGVRTPPQDPSQISTSKPEYPQDGDIDDESWRRPMPHAERRRAGKHTRRVIVR